MTTPAAIYLGVTLCGLLLTLNHHGQPKKGNHSIFIHLAALSISYGLLIWGGFFAARA